LQLLLLLLLLFHSSHLHADSTAQWPVTKTALVQKCNKQIYNNKN